MMSDELTVIHKFMWGDEVRKARTILKMIRIENMHNFQFICISNSSSEYDKIPQV